MGVESGKSDKQTNTQTITGFLGYLEILSDLIKSKKILERISSPDVSLYSSILLCHLQSTLTICLLAFSSYSFPLTLFLLLLSSNSFPPTPFLQLFSSYSFPFFPPPSHLHFILQARTLVYDLDSELPFPTYFHK